MPFGRPGPRRTGPGRSFTTFLWTFVRIIIIIVIDSDSIRKFAFFYAYNLLFFYPFGWLGPRRTCPGETETLSLAGVDLLKDFKLLIFKKVEFPWPAYLIAYLAGAHFAADGQLER